MSVLGIAAQLILMNGPVCAARLLVERLGHQLLAGAALAGDEHGGRRVRHALDHREDRRSSPGSARRARTCPCRRRRRSGTAPGAAPSGWRPPGRSPSRRSVDRVLLERLLDVIERARLDRLDGLAHRAVRRDHDDRHVRVVPRGRAQDLHAVGPRHAQIRDAPRPPRRSARCASSPVAACTTSCPSRRSIAASTRRKFCSSSATRIFADPIWAGAYLRSSPGALPPPGRCSGRSRARRCASTFGCPSAPYS